MAGGHRGLVEGGARPGRELGWPIDMKNYPTKPCGVAWRVTGSGFVAE